MGLLAFLAENHPGLTAAVAGHLDAAVNAATGSIPVVLGLCAVAGVAAAAAVALQMHPAPEPGQVWVARRRDLRGIRVRIIHTGVWPSAVVLTPPPGPLADHVASAPIHLPMRRRRLPGFQLVGDLPPSRNESS